MDSETEVKQGGPRIVAHEGDVIEMKITPRWVTTMDGFANVGLAMVLCTIVYFLWHIHNDVWSLQIKAGLIDSHGKLKQEYQDQMDDARYHVMDWNRP